MNGKQLAEMLQGIAKNRNTWAELAGFVRDDLGAPLRNLADSGDALTLAAKIAEQYPDQSGEEMFRAIFDVLRKDRLSIPHLVGRINEVRANGANGKDELWSDITSLPVSTSKQLVKALGGRAASKSQATELLREYLNGTPMPQTKTDGVNGADAEKIDKAYRKYAEIRDQLSQLSFEDIRARFEPIEKQTKKVIEGLVAKLGYRYRGSKKDLIAQLRGDLESTKGSRINSELIDSA